MGSMSLNTGRFAERAVELEENPSEFAIPSPRFARKLSTGNRPSHAEGTYPLNYMVEQPRNPVSETRFYVFQCWKKSFKTEERSCSSLLTDVVLWNQEVEMVESVGRSQDVAVSRRACIPEC